MAKPRDHDDIDYDEISLDNTPPNTNRHSWLKRTLTSHGRLLAYTGAIIFTAVVLFSIAYNIAASSPKHTTQRHTPAEISEMNMSKRGRFHHQPYLETDNVQEPTEFNHTLRT